MQVARLMRPKERTYVNKALETLLALKIELYYTKDEILRLYLNHAPYGGNIVGYQAAAHKYFRKPPDKLTWSEAATLAVLPNAPGLVSPTANPQQLMQKRNRLLARPTELRLLRRGDLALGPRRTRTHAGLYGIRFGHRTCRARSNAVAKAASSKPP